MYPKTNEWNLLKQQFDALADEESPDADSIEEIFDMEFRRRFGELINQTAHHRRRTGTSLPAMFCLRAHAAVTGHCSY